MRVLSAGWSGYAIWRTIDIHTRFTALITNGACGVDLFPHYFHDRLSVQIADLVLNVIALLVSCYLVWRLVKVRGFTGNYKLNLTLTTTDVCDVHVHSSWRSQGDHEAIQGGLIR